MSSDAKATVLICGAGVAGPTLALNLLTNPELSSLYKPVLIDSLPQPPPHDSFSTTPPSYASGACIIISPNAIFPLNNLPLTTSVASISEECLHNDLWTNKGRWMNRMNSPAYAPDIDCGLLSMERSRLQALLVHSYLARGGEALWESKVSGVHQSPSGVEVELEDGRRIGGDLLVGADGVWSRIRRSMLGEENWKPAFKHASGFFGIGGRPEGKSDEEVTGRAHGVFSRSGVTSTWPLPDGRQFFSLLTAEKKEPEGRNELVEFKPGVQLYTGGYSVESTRELVEKFKGDHHPLFGTFGKIIDNAERIVRVALWHRVYAKEEIQKDGNIVLIGDAARTMVPTAGQGACMAIEEATVLADSLLNNPPIVQNGKRSLDAALKEYAERRYPRSKRIAKESEIRNVFAVGDGWIMSTLRDFLTAMMPMGTDNRQLSREGKNVDLGWLFGARFEVKKRENGGEVGDPKLPKGILPSF